MLLSDEPCFKLTNLFLKKMQVPEWGKQWYNGLRPENPGVQALAKLRMGHESPKKNTAFGWLISFGLYYSPLLFLWMMSPLSKKKLPESPFTNRYFHGILTLRGMSGTFKNAVVCQGLRNFFHHQLPQLRLLGCLKSRFFSLTVQCYGGHGAQPWDAFFVSKNWWLKLFNPVDENVWNLHHGGTVGFEAPVGWNSSYFVVPT